jgi:CheY-specific phosphatase CheX
MFDLVFILGAIGAVAGSISIVLSIHNALKDRPKLEATDAKAQHWLAS